MPVRRPYTDARGVNILQVECPRCHMPPNEACRSSGGKYNSFPHVERFDLAREMVKSVQPKT